MTGVESRPDVGAGGIDTLLGVWAHPDDEAYLSSGLMAQVRRAGGRVVVATATRGEHGTDDPETWPPELLAAHREQELRESLAIVGVHEHRWLPHRDGELASIPVATGVAGLVPILEDVRPDTIVTFGPDGMTGHDDHRTISAWTTEAWRLTGCRGDLWYATLTPEFHDEWGRLNDEVGLWFEGSRPPSTPRSALRGARAPHRSPADPEAPRAAGARLADPTARVAGGIDGLPGLVGRRELRGGSS